VRYLALLMVLFAAAVVTCATSAPGGEGKKTGEAKLNPQLREYIVARIGEFDQIPAERKAELRKLATYVRGRLAASQPAQLTFICTHNSRRSHLGQLWAAAGAAYYGVPNVATFSGGTEATAFNPRAVAALQRAGFKVTKLSEDSNPQYQVVLGEGLEPELCFSKIYDQAPNPTSDYCAVMTCSQADKACPVVRGAAMRVAIPYDDPKAFDGTPQEAAQYSERCAQIAREILYLFSQVKS
jgi:arsenate reductase (thioredoxin)